jgi:cellulose synthase/poly-beta-1,6-N-acetylglucosamine synthase-like glycosyltransferase
MLRVDARELEKYGHWGRFTHWEPFPWMIGRMVSIHLATHAEATQLVAHTLESLAALNWQNKEIVVLDNNTASPVLWQPATGAGGGPVHFCADRRAHPLLPL